MTAYAGRVAGLRTCEPWTRLFHMALACRVTEDFVMIAVTHTISLPPGREGPTIGSTTVT